MCVDNDEVRRREYARESPMCVAGEEVCRRCDMPRRHALLRGAAHHRTRRGGNSTGTLAHQVHHFLLFTMKGSIPFWGVVYNNICLSAFNTFSCVQLRDGSMVSECAPTERPPSNGCRCGY